MNAPVIQLNVSQTLRAHFETFQGLLSETVTPEKALAIQLGDFAKEIAVHRETVKEAWAEMAKYKHPKTGEGQIKDLTERIARYTAEGERDGAEMAAIKSREESGNSQRGDKIRKVQLTDELDKDSANVRSAKGSLENAQRLFEEWLDRYEQRDRKLKEMQAEYEALQKEGPLWLAQIRDSKKAEEEADKDARDGSGSFVVKSQNLRASLKSQAEMASLHEEAGRVVDEKEPSLDEEIAAREEKQASDELINSWITGAK